MFLPLLWNALAPRADQLQLGLGRQGPALEQSQRLRLLLVYASLGGPSLRRPLPTPGLTPGRGCVLVTEIYHSCTLDTPLSACHVSDASALCASYTHVTGGFRHPLD